jgi:hypothetical protein
MTLIDESDAGIIWDGGIERPYEKIFFTRIPREIISQLYHSSKLNSMFINKLKKSLKLRFVQIIFVSF